MTLYDLNWEYTMKTLLADLRISWITLFGDESTINTITMVDDLADGVNNPFVLLGVFNFLYHCTELGKKYSLYISIMLLPLINNFLNMKDVNVSF